MRNKFLGTGEPGYRPVRKMRIILNGLRFSVLNDASVAYKVVISLFTIGISCYFEQWIDLMAILIVTGLMLASELFNSSIEAICDFLVTEENEKIGVIKDISAAATGVAILVWLLVMVYEYYHIFQRVFG
ncbi:MAG: diacylglycerol kinase [Deltaproteobacteria bacterium]|nr:diacylglycerol kinase [Deltaproteobacteria bacterium]TLN01375.1 MAG: diacylglycerol kinase [bacterium]